jgi:Tol biopolymer transport system component/DNA-binding winged helix-turn-helix (wHTH) protein
MDKPASEAVRFGDFEVNLRTGEVRRQGRKLRVPHQSFLVLSLLLSRPGDLVTREELRAAVWPPDTAVEYEQGLNAIVNRLRDVFGDAAANPRFIETLPKRGYRFIGRIEPALPDATSDPAERTAPVAAVDQLTPLPRALSRAGILWFAVSVCGLGALTIFAFGWRGSETEGIRATFSPERLRPATTLDGEEVAPALSPDGMRLAFAWRQGDAQGFDLYLGDLTSGTPVRLTHRPADTLLPAWSPDGSRIAFLRSGDADGGLYVIPSLGGREQRLAEARPPASLGQVSWSPDGSRIAFADIDGSGSSAVRVLSPVDLAIESVPVDGACLETGLPAFSPDGQQLAFVCTTSVAVYRIRVMDIRTSESRDIGTMFGYPQGLTWLADGDALVVANEGGDRGRLWRVDLEGATQLLPFAEGASAPTVSHASGRLAYVRSSRDIDIRMVRLDDASREEMTSQRVLTSSRLELMPRLSPDGTQVAFQSDRSGANEIWVGRLDGSDLTRVTSFAGPLVGGPDWCSDGKRLAFDARATGTAAVYISTVGEGAPRRLETSVDNLSLPIWSPDCRVIVASDGRGRLYEIPSGGGPATPLTGQPSYYAQMSGDRVVFNVKQQDGVQLWSRPIAGGEETAIRGVPLLRYDEPWATSSSGVYVVRTIGGRTSVQFYDWSVDALRHVAWLADRPLPLGGLGLSVSADGRTLLFAHQEHSESDVMVIDRQ